MHYKSIKFNIKIALNIHNFHFWGALCAKSLILRLCARSAPILLGGHFSNFAPPPPSEKWIDAAVQPPHFKKASYALATKYINLMRLQSFVSLYLFRIHNMKTKTRYI